MQVHLQQNTNRPIADNCYYLLFCYLTTVFNDKEKEKKKHKTDTD